MDASVIRIKDSKDFHAISNVGDTSFGKRSCLNKRSKFIWKHEKNCFLKKGIHDVDERILAHIINEKSLRSRVKRRQISLLDSNSAYDLETVNAYANLIKNIKQNIVENGAVTVDLAYIDETSNREEISASNNHDELFIDKRLIYDSLCRDIYDWSLAHIEKAIIQVKLSKNYPFRAASFQARLASKKRDEKNSLIELFKILLVNKKTHSGLKYTF